MKPGTTCVYRVVSEPFRLDAEDLWGLKVLASEDGGKNRLEKTLKFSSQMAAEMYTKIILALPLTVNNAIRDLEFDLSVYKQMRDTGEYFQILVMSDDDEEDEDEDDDETDATPLEDDLFSYSGTRLLN
jgi:hypothetical protein